MDLIGGGVSLSGSYYIIPHQKVWLVRKYLIISTGISLVFLVTYYFLNESLFQSYLHKQFPALILFFYLQSLAVWWMLRLGEKSNWESPVYVLGGITFRFLTGLFFLAILFIMKPENIRPLMIQFIVLYLVYLIFELFAALPNLRRN